DNQHEDKAQEQLPGRLGDVVARQLHPSGVGAGSAVGDEAGHQAGDEADRHLPVQRHAVPLRDGRLVSWHPRPSLRSPAAYTSAFPGPGVKAACTWRRHRMGYLSLSGRPLRQLGGPCMTGGFVNSERTTGTRRTRAAATRPAKRASARRAAADPLLQLLAAMQDVAAGDFSVQLPLHWDGVEGKLAGCFNDIVSANRRLAAELARVGQKVGRQGQVRQRMHPANRQGAWAEMEHSVNQLVDDLVRPVETMTEAIAGVAKGDLTRTVPLEADGRPLQGEFLRSANIVNRMIEQMGEFSSEVTRVALEVGTAGLLGGQAKVKGVSGVWKDLTDSVNQMASNLTAQVRNIADVTIAVANGDLSRKITVDVRGEILQLKEAINTMVDQLRGFASEVTRVAREVGTEGKLGGQAIVPGVAGTW